MIVGTAGHIDHGKTTLVKALTGVDCDRLQEEKARGITLDLGYAYSPLSSAAPGAAPEVLGFIDVPGHEKLIHNMLAGATGIDLALLVVAADDGPMPQTREHLEIVELLGIPRLAVALTKIDRADDARRAAALAEVAALLAATPYAEAPVFPVAALSGEGVAELRDDLEREADTQAAHAARGGFRLAIDRAFTLSGVGTVVTGTAFAGRVAVGDTLTLSPPGTSVRVRSLRVQDRPAESGQAGQRIALALAGIEKSAIERGMWLVTPALHLPQRRFAARLRVLAGQPPLKHWTQVHCHLAAEDVTARIALLAGDEIEPGASGYAEIITDRELGVLAGDRLILRDAAARRTLAGGTVLDAFPPTRHKRSAQRLAMLDALADPDPAPALALAAETQPAGVELARHALNRNLASAEVDGLCQRLGLIAVSGIAFAPPTWQRLATRLGEALADEHTRSPDLPGVERERLRRLTLPTLPRAAFDALVEGALTAGDIARSGAWLHLPGHRIELAAGDRDLWLAFKPLLDAEPYNPPRVRDIARATGIAENTVRQALKRVARVGEVYPVALDHYFTDDAVADLARRVADLCATHGMARAAQLRDEIGGGRKVAIQILEFFDRIGYTRRVRDYHTLRGGSALAFGTPLR